MDTLSKSTFKRFFAFSYLLIIIDSACIVVTCDHAPISVAEQSLGWMNYRRERKLEKIGARTADLTSDLVLYVFCILSSISSFT